MMFEYELDLTDSLVSFGQCCSEYRWESKRHQNKNREGKCSFWKTWKRI